MRDSHLFGLALGLSDPWYVERCEFDRGRSQLDLHIDFKKGARLACPECGRGACAVHDTEAKTWRHLNFFEHGTFLHARTPRIKCERCGVKTAQVPWARKGSGFTLLFEAFVMCLAKEMPINAIGGIVFEWDTRLWRIVHHYVDQARANDDFSRVKSVGVDETSSKRGHNYISVFVDLERSKALYATEGKGAETVVTGNKRKRCKRKESFVQIMFRKRQGLNFQQARSLSQVVAARGRKDHTQSFDRKRDAIDKRIH